MSLMMGGKMTMSHGISLSRLVLMVFGGSALLLCLASVDFLRRTGAAQSRRDEIAALFLNGNEIGGIADEIAKLDPSELVASAPVVGGGVPADQSLKEVPNGYMENNWGDNVHLLVKENRQTDEASNSSLKTILMWNNAYGSRRYDIGHGREPFFKYGCEETRCYATDNRHYLPSVDQFDALLIHQRGIEWGDMPKSRSPKQRWIHWNIESPQYVTVDIAKLNGMFNWTMTHKRTSDFWLPYGRVVKVREHPKGKALEEYITAFGKRNRHLAEGRDEFRAAWFVSHCATQARREVYARMMKNYMGVDIFGKCGKLKCGRENETACYERMEREYRFYLSFENSVCDDYVTEKFWNILEKVNVIPITYGGSDYSALAPPHSYINALAFPSVKKLVAHLRTLQEDDAKFAEYFWWRDFYAVRQGEFHRAQAYCDLCKRLHNPEEPPKVYENMFKWWITDSHCKKLRTSAFDSSRS